MVCALHAAVIHAAHEWVRNETLPGWAGSAGPRGLSIIPGFSALPNPARNQEVKISAD